MVATSKSLREPTGLWRNACASVHIYETSLAEFKETGCLEGNEQLHLECVYTLLSRAQIPH